MQVSLQILGSLTQYTYEAFLFLKKTSVSNIFDHEPDISHYIFFYCSHFILGGLNYYVLT